MKKLKLFSTILLATVLVMIVFAPSYDARRNPSLLPIFGSLCDPTCEMVANYLLLQTHCSTPMSPCQAVPPSR